MSDVADFTREIKVYPSYDHRDDPDGQRGAHGADMMLILRGDLGAIVARISTGWMARPLKGNFARGRQQERGSKPGVDFGVRDNYPSGSYVGSHSYLPREYCSEGGPCDWLETAVCYGDGSYTASDAVLELLVIGGSDAAFEHLAGLYQSWLVDRPVDPAV